MKAIKDLKYTVKFWEKRDNWKLSANTFDKSGPFEFVFESVFKSKEEAISYWKCFAFENGITDYTFEE